MISNGPFSLIPELKVTCAFGDYLRSSLFHSDFNFSFNIPHHCLSSPHFFDSFLTTLIFPFPLVIKPFTLPVQTFCFNKPAVLKVMGVQSTTGCM